MKTVIVAIALAFGLSACGVVGTVGVAGGPVESIVSKEVGYDSYFERGLDWVAEELCGEPRDPVTGDCGEGKWSF